MRSLGRITKASQSAGGVVFELTGLTPAGTLPAKAAVEITVLSPNLLRVRASFPEDGTPIGRKVAIAQPTPTPFTVDQSEPWVLQTPAVTVEVHADPFRLGFLDSSGSPLARGWSGGSLASEVVEGGRRRVRATFSRTADEHFYGLGQGGPGLDRDGTTRHLWNSHYGHGPGTDLAVPLLLSSRGYGLFFDNSWDAEVQVSRMDQANAVVYTAEGGQLDWYFLFGPSLKSLLEVYSGLTGRPPMPPRWTLGYLQSTRHFESPDEVTGLGRAFRERGFPCDAVVFLSTYGEDMGLNDGVGTLDLHPVLFADAPRMLDELRGDGFRLVFHEYPVLHPKSPLYAEAEERGYLVESAGAWSGVMLSGGQRMLDFTNPAVGEWWWDQHRRLIEQGFAGWWLDGGEGPAPTAQLSGGTGEALHNVYDLARQEAFFHGERESRPDSRPFLLCRSGFAGMQRFGSASWSGDINNTFDVFAAQSPLGLSTALSGIPYWGTDIGGFFHTVPESPELFARWFAFGAFCPLFRAHGRGRGPRGWREHLPWAHGPEVEGVCRKFAELRARLLPYNYTLAREAHERGTPLMRPLVLEYPDDPNVVGMSDEYLWGPDFLVAPVTRGGATRWPVYLPEGDWCDYWTGVAYSGGRWVEVAAPLDRMPLFVRAGAIVPLGPIRQHDADSRSDASLELLVYPKGDSAFTLYEDDGETLGYERGEFALTEITCRQSDAGVRLEVNAARGDYRGRPASRAISARIMLERAPRAVSVAGRAALPRLAVAPGLGECGWWYADGFLRVGPLPADSGLVISVDA